MLGGNVLENKIKIVICDDMEEIREYFKNIVDGEKDMECLATCATAKEGVETVERLHPDLVLMDIQMESGEAGIWATEQIKQRFPDIKVIVVTIHEKDDLIFKAYIAGAIDYVVKTSDAEEITNSIRAVYNNKIMLRPDIAQKIFGEFSRMKQREGSFLYMLNITTTLTNTELEILKLLAGGKTRKEIAKERFVERDTINKQITSILKKFDYSNTKVLIKDLSQMGVFEILKSKK